LALSFSNALFPILPLEPSFRRLARASAGESLVVLRGGLGGGGAPLLKDRWGEWWHEFRVALAVRVRRANNINNCAWWFGWWWCLFCCKIGGVGGIFRGLGWLGKKEVA